MIGETIKDFKLTAKLGAGGMGEVWAAEQQIVKTKVAIKLLHSVDAKAVQRFFNEAIAASKIKHAGIVTIYDVGFHGARAYLIMELFEGETLASRIRRSGRLPTAQVAEIGRQIASVLAATHAAGITHRDLKPDNIFLVPDAELASTERVKILDFGIAKLSTGVPMTATGGSMGTPAYMAPEQWSDAASADGRADVYSLGCLVLEMCTGAPPFAATTIGEACTKHLTELPPRASTRVPGVPKALDELIARMLDKDPAKRPPVGEIAAGFARLASEAPQGLAATLAEDTGSHGPSPMTTLGGAAGARDVPAPRRKTLAAAAIGAVVVAGVGIAIYRTQRTPEASVAQAIARPPVKPPPPPPREPKLGLSTIENYREPTGSTIADVRSEQLWLAARDELAASCKEPGAPVRWCAARELADGHVDLLRGDFAAAAAAVERAEGLDPTWAVPPVELASARSARGDLAGALAAAQAAQRLDPAWWQGVAAGARAYANAKQVEDAIGEYRRPLALAPKNAVLLSEVALIYHAGGMDAEADKYGDAALAIDDSLAGVHLLRAERALEKGDGKRAAEEANRALAVSPKNAAAHLALGDALALQGKQADAFAEYQRTIELKAEKHDSAPEKRLAVVEVALGKHVLPPPRGKPAARAVGQQRERSKPNRDTDMFNME